MHPSSRLALAALAALTAGAQSAPQPLPRLAFASRRDGNWELYATDADGARPRRLTTREEQDRFPLPSPDGSQVAFGSQVGADGWQLWVMDADGGRAHPVCTRIAAKGLRQWSPDGTRIALASSRDGDLEIYTVRADGSALTRLTHAPGDDRDPSWSPDGSRIVFSSTRDGTAALYVMRADGGAPTRITTGSAKDEMPVWSPDGAVIAFVSSRDGNRELYTVRPDGSALTRLTDDPAADHAPVWSPDGTRLAFAAARGENYDVDVVRVADRARWRVAATAAYDGMPAWSPDGTRLAFVSARDGTDALYVADADGGHPRRVTDTPTLNPAWLPATPPRRAPERVDANDNRVAAGTLRDGVLTLRLEAREGTWYPEADADRGIALRGIALRAFGEAGRPASVPGPLVRVPEGTVIHATVHNALPDSALVVHGLATRGPAATPGADTLRVRPGETRAVRFVAGAPGTYYYWASDGGTLDRRGIDSQLGGAFVIDPRGAPRDRVLVLGVWARDRLPGGAVGRRTVLRFAINGRSWPHTERLTYTVGDSVRFRVVNVSNAPHPMHLHGFYFDVGSRGDGTRDSVHDPAGSRHLVVTERLAPGRTATMTWVPERPGYWLFHCHDNFHVLRNAPLDGSPLPPEESVHTHNHAVDMMGGLVMAIEVRPRATVAVRAAAAPPDAPRRLRLVARVDTGGTAAEPAYGYVLHDGARPTPDGAPLLPGPTIVLKRGEPVRITVVNALPEPTAVHWHGIELDSYYDGVADFSGHPGRVAPAIAPGDSFEVHFTPPRAGTFMYHPHADEVRQQQAGLAGALLVVDDPARHDATHDRVLLITVPRRAADRDRVLLNGSATPAPLALRVGERYRLRLVNLHTFRPSLTARLLRDSVPVRWRAVAKDGMTLPGDQATVRPAVQLIGNGESYDFELVPDAPGELRFAVTAATGASLVAMVVRVTP